MTGGSFYPRGYSGANYDVEELREIADSDEEDDGPEPNYKCQSCKWETYIDDYTTTAPNWCEYCEAVKSFVRLQQ